MAPFQRAMCAAETPPAPVKYPPAINWELWIASAETRGQTPSIPAPNGPHEEPSHRAIRPAGRSPALVKSPPAIRSVPYEISVKTMSSAPDPRAPHPPVRPLVTFERPEAFATSSVVFSAKEYV